MFAIIVNDHAIGENDDDVCGYKPVQFPSVLGAVSKSESCEDPLPFVKGHSLLQLPKQFYLRRMLMTMVLVVVVEVVMMHIFPRRLFVAGLVETWKLMRSMFACPGCSSIVSRSRIEGQGMPRVSPN